MADDRTASPWLSITHELIEMDPDASWSIVRHPLPSNPALRVPYMETPLGIFVETEITFKGRKELNLLALTDDAPDAASVEAAIERSFIKSARNLGFPANSAPSSSAQASTRPEPTHPDHTEGSSAAATGTISEAQAEKLRDLLVMSGRDAPRMLNWLGKPAGYKLEQLTVSEFEKVRDALTSPNRTQSH